MNTVFQVLTLAWSLQGGQYFNNAVNDAGVFSTNNNFFVETGFEFQIPFSWVKGDRNNLFLGANTENQFFKPQFKDWTFSPWQDTFTFVAGVRVVGIEVGFEHQCTHPIVFSQNENTSKYISSYDKIYIRTTGTF